MKESYREGVANHSDPEPCEGSCEAVLEALDRGICRLGIELRKAWYGAPMTSDVSEGNRTVRHTRALDWSRGVVDPKHAEKLHAREPGDPVTARANSGPEGERDERQVLHKRRRGVVQWRNYRQSSRTKARTRRRRLQRKVRWPRRTRKSHTRTGHRAGESEPNGLARVREAAKKG